ncbi:hypothetical protein EJD96_22060 [Herbaspirillum seropedicae]|uniref:hypothetical protein n=1 Tax=Herbaspirillum seropedicae TaxID=964 RepID=UPI00111F633E|nr:hypothetical protein [Herbaspirillum seropedicae]QDD66655.1 hypothetical protein EJD96_22060 [Herbaspirillum seropedicae]
MSKILMACALLVALAGCATTKTPQTKEQVASSIVVQTGYNGCKDCDQIKSYAGPSQGLQKHFGTQNADGWLNLNVGLISSNIDTALLGDTEPHQRYRLASKVLVNGTFQKLSSEGGVEFWVVRDDGSLQPLDNIDTIKNFKCFSSIGSGCSWDQITDLPTAIVDAAYLGKRSIKLMAGRTLRDRVAGNDGYKRVTTIQEHVQGFTFELSSDMIVGFLDGMKNLGASLPSVAEERRIAQADTARRKQALAAAEDKKKAELPQKRQIGAKICRFIPGPNWTEIGFTEGVSGEKIQIRVVQRARGRVSDGSFHETIVWDYPDNWSLCR